MTQVATIVVPDPATPVQTVTITLPDGTIAATVDDVRATITLEGPPGPAGSGSRLVFTQTSPASVWTVNHGLNKPSVQVFDALDDLIYPDIAHTSPTQVIVSFPAPVSGTAVLT